MSAPEMVSWWSPDIGWRQDGAPAAHVALHAQPAGASLDYAGAGYEREGYAFPPEEAYSAAGHMIVRSAGDHLRVETWDSNAQTSLFFVAADDAAAFRATLWPAMMQAAAAVWQAEETRIMRRAMVAFIRHGAGKMTIDPHGDQDRDECQAEQEADRWQAARGGEGT